MILRTTWFVICVCLCFAACSNEDALDLSPPEVTGGAPVDSGGVQSGGGVLEGGGMLESGGQTVTGGVNTGGTLQTGGAPTGGLMTGGMMTGGEANTGGMGSGGAIAGPPPFVPSGDPLTGADGAWSYVSFPNTQCRDGSAAGINVYRSAGSKKLMIYFEGGGACFEGVSCLINPVRANTTAPGSVGIFDRGHSDNPVKDWNYVYVPFCSGDVHGGTKADALPYGVPVAQQFRGRSNVEAFMERVLPTFADMDEVLVTGSSAGGFGAAINWEYIQWTFGDIPVSMIDDSGPPMSTDFIRPCLMEEWAELWGFEEGFLADCGDDCPDWSNYTVDYSIHVANKAHPEAMAGLFETTADSVISLFYGFGTDTCPAETVSAAQFEAGLIDFRETVMMHTDRFGTYYVPGSAHTILMSDGLYSTTVNGTRLIDWVTDIVEGTAAAHVGP